MKKALKIILIIIIAIVLLFIIDFICIFTINRPILAVKEDQNVYRGLLYDTYNCAEYAVPQIKSKGNKFTCAENLVINVRVESIVDKTKSIEGFVCAEALEQLYEDDEYTYCYSCIKSKYIVVKYSDGSEETVSDALKNRTITISDLDDYNIKYYKYEK